MQISELAMVFQNPYTSFKETDIPKYLKKDPVAEVLISDVGKSFEHLRRNRKGISPHSVQDRPIYTILPMVTGQVYQCTCGQ